MKKILFLLLLVLFITQYCFPDQLIIPFECNPKQIQKAFKAHGIKLDLSGNDKTKHSWGFLQNEGSRYVIYTYKLIDKKDLELVQQIVMETCK